MRRSEESVVAAGAGYAKRFADYGTTVVADAAHRAGSALAVPDPGICPLDPTARMVGPVVTVEANNDLAAIIATVHIADEGAVVAIANHSAEVAVIGDLIGTEAVRRGLAGFVVEGRVRDTRRLIALGVPVFCRGPAVVGPLKVPAGQRGVGVADTTIEIGGVPVAPGSWAFGDADGVVFLAAADLDTVFAAAASAAQREAALEDTIRSGTPLGTALDIDAFLAKRELDPSASFGEHIAGTDWAI